MESRWAGHDSSTLLVGPVVVVARHMEKTALVGQSLLGVVVDLNEMRMKVFSSKQPPCRSISSKPIKSPQEGILAQ